MERSRKALSLSHGAFHDSKCKLPDVQVEALFLAKEVASSWQLQSTIEAVHLFAHRIVR